MHSFDGTWYVMDLGSRYGTLLNGTKIEPKKYVPLQEGALLRLGAHRATMAPSYYGYACKGSYSTVACRVPLGRPSRERALWARRSPLCPHPKPHPSRTASR